MTEGALADSSARASDGAEGPPVYGGPRRHAHRPPFAVALGDAAAGPRARRRRAWECRALEQMV
eukprot:5009398-Pyramimonas_sp.AAC.1